MAGFRDFLLIEPIFNVLIKNSLFAGVILFRRDKTSLMASISIERLLVVADAVFL